jgi:transcriptional regulator with XRE-family HTH domain
MTTTNARLREWRKQRKLTQRQLGDYFGVSAKTISHWESGRRPIPFEEMILKNLEYYDLKRNIR